MYLVIHDPTQGYADQQTTYMRVETDVVMTNPLAYNAPDRLGIKLLGSSPMNAATLEELMARACFRTSTDGDAEPDEDRERFEAEAANAAQELLEGHEKALSGTIRRIVEREILPLVEKHHLVEVQVTDGRDCPVRC